MGEVVYDFLLRRIAQRHVELSRKHGTDYAQAWWKAFPFNPTPEQFESIKEYIKEYANTNR